MKKTIYIITLIVFIFSINLNAENKLITIYDNDCVFCDNLLNDTYQNGLVKVELKNYNHQLFEINSELGKSYIEQYKITSYPTQILINEQNTIVFNGYLNTNQQIEFLSQPQSFITKFNDKKELANSSLIFDQDSFIPDMVIRYLCTTMNNGKSSESGSFEKFMIAFRSMLDKLNKSDKFKIKEVDNLNKYTFENIDKLVCKNKSIIQVREYTTLLKYAIDSVNYDFIDNAAFIKIDRKNVCNPYIDFNRIEIIDGEEETLINFIDKILNEDGMDAFHDFNTLRRIRDTWTVCSAKQILYESHELENLSESQLKKIRLQPINNRGFYNRQLAYIYYFSEKDYKTKIGFIDKTGTLVIPFIYEDSAYSFTNGMIAVKKDNKWGWINQKNETIIPFIYDIISIYKSDFSKENNYRTEVTKDGKTYYINKENKCVKNCE